MRARCGNVGWLFCSAFYIKKFYQIIFITTSVFKWNTQGWALSGTQSIFFFFYSFLYAAQQHWGADLKLMALFKTQLVDPH